MDREPRNESATNDQAQSPGLYTSPCRLLVFKCKIDLDPNGPGRHAIDEDEWKVCNNRAAVTLAL